LFSLTLNYVHVCQIYSISKLFRTVVTASVVLMFYYSEVRFTTSLISNYEALSHNYVFTA